jgi:hypothetical protein
MFIGHKANTIIGIGEVEWMCRSTCKRLYTPEYWTWVATITSGDPPVVDLSGETGYTIVECTDEDVQARLNQLGDYQAEGVYNIKYYASKRDAEEIKDIDGNSHDPKQYVQSHFVGQDDTRDARLLAEQWTRIRRERDRLLSECDWTQAADVTLTSNKKNKWLTYREQLRDVPGTQSSKTTYADITWPIKP